MEKEYKLSRESFEKTKEELSYLRSTGRDEIAHRIAEARSQGDLSENAEYDAAMNDQAQMEAKIRELEYIVDHAVIIDETNLSLDSVRVGLSVDVMDLTWNEECTYHIVGTPDVKPFDNKISDESPVGKALCGHKVGDRVIAETPSGNIEIEILRIFKQ